MVHVFMQNNVLHFAGEDDFDKELVQRAQDLAMNSGTYQLHNLSFSKFYHILAYQTGTLFLVGLRSKLSYDLQPKEVLLKEAPLANLSVL